MYIYRKMQLLLGHIYSLFTWDACSFVSGSQDGTSRLWDIRQPECAHVIPARPSSIFSKFSKKFKIKVFI